ncbi:MAG: hypothetical protein HYT09_04145 [Candidatus Levybacteria bacterium]|nr:hypothetical protein [Candidatus Levybacteria bacterium]
MKFKFLLFFGFFLVFLFLYKDSSAAQKNPYRHLCVGIEGTFRAENWKGGAVQVGCSGDSGAGAPNQSQACSGEVQNVKPGQEFRLTKCSCFGGENGCLKIANKMHLGPLQNGKKKIIIDKPLKDMPVFKNNKCDVIKRDNICGKNGDRIKGNFKISCVARSVPTPTNTPKPTKPKPSATPTPYPSVPPTITRPPTPTPTPPFCPVPKQVVNIKISCPNCVVTPTPTPEEGDQT